MRLELDSVGTGIGGRAHQVGGNRDVAVVVDPGFRDDKAGTAGPNPTTRDHDLGGGDHASSVPRGLNDGAAHFAQRGSLEKTLLGVELEAGQPIGDLLTGVWPVVKLRSGIAAMPHLPIDGGANLQSVVADMLDMLGAEPTQLPRADVDHRRPQVRGFLDAG